jgi:cysteine sulfinate desulfinase/cysteine desulfurase-like protein
VLLAVGLSREEAHCSIRISLGPENTEEEVERTITAFGRIISDSGSEVRFVACR